MELLWQFEQVITFNVSAIHACTMHLYMYPCGALMGWTIGEL